MVEGRISSLSDGIALIENMRGVALHSTVRVGKSRIPGTVIAINGDTAKALLFDNWQDLLIGDRAVSDNIPLSVELGPGLIGHTFDALLRPIGSRDKNEGALNKRKRWVFVPKRDFGDRVCSGDIVGYVRETLSVRHAITVPQGLCGTVVELNSGSFCVNDRIGKIKKDDGTIVDISLLQLHDLSARRSSGMLAPSKNVFCGLLATDVFFPIEKGGVALIVGDTASSASDMLTRLTLESDSDVNVVVLCGKSLNVIYSRLREYKTHMARQKTVFILSPQSDRFEMRKKSLESAFAVAEYFRETGLNVLLSIDTINAILELAPKNATLSCLTDLLKRAARTESAAKNASYASLTVVTTASQSLVAALEQIKSSVGTYIELECENCYPTNGSINFDGSFSKSNCRNASADGIVHALINISDGKDSESAYLARLALKAILNADFLSAHAKDVFDAQTLVSSERAFLDSVLRLCREAERSPTKCRQVLTDILSLCENITPEITEGTIT